MTLQWLVGDDQGKVDMELQNTASDGTVTYPDAPQLTVGIRNVFGKLAQQVNGSSGTNLPLCSGGSPVTLTVPTEYFAGVPGVAISDYIWAVPQNWVVQGAAALSNAQWASTSSNTGNAYYLRGRSITVTPPVGEGNRTVWVRFYNRTCYENAAFGNILPGMLGDERAFTFTREPVLTVSNVPATVRCGDRTAFTPSVTNSQSLAASYTYSVGSGWTAGSTKGGPIMVTPSGTSGTTLTVTPTYTCGSTSVPGTPKNVAIGYTPTQATPTLVTIPELCPGQRKIIVATKVPGATYTWSGVSAPLTLTHNTPTDWFAYIEAPASLTTAVRPTVRVTANSAYGCADTYSEAPVKAGYGSAYLDYYPAPAGYFVCANSVINFRVVEPQVIGESTDFVWNITNCTILSDYGGAVRVQAPMSGSFRVGVQYKDGCGASRSLGTNAIYTATSINGQPCSTGPMGPRPTAYPNPANETLTLENLRGTAELHNAQGRVVLRQQLPAAGLATLDVRALPAGLYYLTGVDATGQAVRQTVQVQH